MVWKIGLLILQLEVSKDFTKQIHSRVYTNVEQIDDDIGTNAIEGEFLAI